MCFLFELVTTRVLYTNARSMAFMKNSELCQKMKNERDDEIDQILEKAERTIDYKFKDKFILWEALQCGAGRPDVWFSRFKDRSRSQHGNKRLALIGDAVLRLVFTCVMFTNDHDPGMVFVHIIPGGIC